MSKEKKRKKTVLDEKIEALFHELYQAHEKDSDIACVVAKKENGCIGSGVFGNADDVVQIILDIMNRGAEISVGVFDKIIKYADAKSLTKFVERIFNERPDVMKAGHILQIPNDASAEQMSEMINEYTKSIKDEEAKIQPAGEA